MCEHLMAQASGTAGPAANALERLLVDRVVMGWLQVYAAEATRPRPPGPAIVDLTATTPPQADATPDPLALVPGDPPPDPGRRGIAGHGIRVPTVRPGRAEIVSGLDPHLVHRVVRSHLRELRRCYDRGLARDRDLAGRVAVGLVIATNGQVSAASVQQDTLRDGLVAPCIAAAARRWRAPIAVSPCHHHHSSLAPA